MYVSAEAQAMYSKVKLGYQAPKGILSAADL